jgi:hypothetical protein
MMAEAARCIVRQAAVERKLGTARKALAFRNRMMELVRMNLIQIEIPKAMLRRM